MLNNQADFDMIDWESIPIDSDDDDSSVENLIDIQDKNSELNGKPVGDKSIKNQQQQQLVYTPGGITTSPHLGSSS